MGRKSGLTRTLAIIGVFAALALSGLIYFLINRVQTDSLEELRIQARQEEIPLSLEDSVKMGYLPARSPAHESYEKLIAIKNNNLESQAFFDRRSELLTPFFEDLEKASPQRRKQIAASLIAKAEVLEPIRGLVVKASKQPVWGAPARFHRQARGLMQVVWVGHMLSHVGAARAIVGDVKGAEEDWIAAHRMGRHIAAMPTFVGQSTGPLLLSMVYQSVQKFDHLQPNVLRSMDALREELSEPIEFPSGRSLTLVYLSESYDNWFNQKAPDGRTSAERMGLKMSQIEAAELAWLTQIQNVMATVRAPNATLDEMLAGLRSFGGPVDAATEPMYRKEFAVNPGFLPDGVTGSFSFAIHVLEPITDRNAKVEAEKQKIAKLFAR